MNKYMQFWILDGPKQLLDWVTRPINIGLKIAGLGVLFLLAPNALNWAVEAYVVGINGSVKITAGSAQLPDWLNITLYVVGAILLLVGIIVALHSYVVDRQTASRTKIVTIEFRGLIDNSDAPLLQFSKGPVLAQKTELLFDIREHVSRKTTAELQAALVKLQRLPFRLKEILVGYDRQDFSLVVGGLMPVPFLFYVGYLLDDESPLTLMDWERHEKKWIKLVEQDDGERFKTIDAPTSSSQDVVLTVSASYLADYDAISKCFPNTPIYRLELASILPNKLWSDGKQKALSQQFLETVVKLANSNVKTIHLFLACPSSLCLRLGTIYDRRNLPEIIIYQYEKSQSPSYPWGVKIPSNENALGELIKLAI